MSKENRRFAKSAVVVCGSLLLIFVAVWGLTGATARSVTSGPGESEAPTPPLVPTLSPIMTGSPIPSVTGMPTMPPVSPGPTVSPVPTVTGSPMTLPSPIATGTPIRDLTQYENGGTISMGAYGNIATRRAAFALARTFISRKWNERSRGYVALISPTPATQTVTGRFYIEPKSGNTWRVMLEAPGRTPEEYTIVEPIGIAANGQPIINPGPGSPSAVSQGLHLKRKADAMSGLIL